MTQARNLSRLLNKDITTYMYTATAGQTAFTGSDDNSQTLTFDNQSIMVTYNGVMLEKGSEFTVATNTVTLLAGAEVNAEVNVIVFNNASLGGYVKSTGGDIDGGVNITSGHLLVGNTDTSPYDRTSGNAISIGDGLVSSAQSGGNAAIFNRMTNDGSIVGFRKNGSEVGSIGADGVNLTINSASTGHLQTVGTSRYYWDDAQFYPANTNSKNLGHPSYQFKDAYLSGGVYLGGTVAANKLDDYEEGTWTPKLGDNTTPISTVQTATYVKVGRMVTIQCDVTVQAYSGASSNYLRGLPFPGIAGVGTGGGCVGWTTSTSQPAFHVTGASTDFYFVSFNTGNSALNISGERYIFSSTYETNA